MYFVQCVVNEECITTSVVQCSQAANGFIANSTTTNKHHTYATLAVTGDLHSSSLKSVISELTKLQATLQHCILWPHVANRHISGRYCQRLSQLFSL